MDTLEEACHLVKQTLEGFMAEHINILGETVILCLSTSRSNVNLAQRTTAGVGCFLPITQEPKPDDLLTVFQTNVSVPSTSFTLL